MNQPVSPYAASKASAELFLPYLSPALRFAGDNTQAVYSLRPEAETGDGSPRFTRQIDTGQEVNIFGDGKSYREYNLYRRYRIRLTSSLDYQGDPFQIINLGDGRPVELAYLIRIIEEALDKKAVIKYSEPIPGDVPATIADISKAEKLLGYHPKVGIEEGVSRFVRWYRQRKEQ